MKEVAVKAGPAKGGLLREIGESKWPAQEESEHEISTVNQYLTITEPSSWDFVPGSLRFEMVFAPEGAANWVFTWETLHWTSAADDWVEFAPQSNCGDIVAGQLVPGGSSGVTSAIAYKIDPGTKQAVFQHRLEAGNMDCFPRCTIEFTVHSGNS